MDARINSTRGQKEEEKSQNRRKDGMNEDDEDDGKTVGGVCEGGKDPPTGGTTGLLTNSIVYSLKDYERFLYYLNLGYVHTNICIIVLVSER